MALLHRILLHAAQRFATDPEARTRAAELYAREVKPRAAEAAARAKPAIDAAKSELRDAAAETDPRRNPAEFAGRLTRRFIDRARGK